MKLAKIKSLLFYLGCFLAPFFIDRLLWHWIEKDVLNQIGYWLWLHASTEEILNVHRVLIAKSLLGFVPPILLGCLGVLLGRRWLRRKMESPGSPTH